ncbi:MAG TPA: CorA family divalent cation transporter [Candidatus Paceibacterota bacterium]|nr:CorA family divalent cation transporter [Candidatus Paceibacterota bacterium]
MVFRHQRGASWVDLEQPTPEEIAAAVKELGIGGRIADELSAPSPVPLALAEAENALVVLRFPTRDAEESEEREQEVDLVVGRDFLLTVRYEVIAPLHALHKSLEAHELLGVSAKLEADDLLELVLGKIFDAARDRAKNIALRLGKIERDIFSGGERESIRSISLINREFLHLESAVTDNEDPLAHFLAAVERRGLFGPRFAERATRITAEREHVARLANTHRKIASELQATNATLLNATQNEIMKTLTIMAFVTFPLTLVAGIFSMDTRYNPIVGMRDDFWIILGIMLLMAVGFFLYFRLKRWL